MQERANVFISATTADLGSYRLAVRDVLLDRGVHPILQDHLEPDHQTMMDILRQKIDACDAVICLVGFAHGQEPKTAWRWPRAAPIPSWSSRSPRRSASPSMCFSPLTSARAIRTRTSLQELRQLQLEHRERLRQRPHKREYF